MLIEPRPYTDPELAVLVTAQQLELRAAGRTGGFADHVVYPMRDDARYLVGVLGGRAVACGALQVLDADTAEIKRMYVRPAQRGRGLARQILAALEELALLSGRTVLRLETGSYLPGALRLYASSGYAEIPPYGEYAGNAYSVCFEKRLADRFTGGLETPGAIAAGTPFSGG